MITWILIFIIAFTRFTICQNGFGYKTPPMVWNPYNAFGLTYDETTIKQHADVLASEGYLEVGYRYINLDDGWQAPTRNVSDNNTLTPNLNKFPSGIKALADYIHDKGLLFGIYSDAGTETCGRLPGSLDNEDKDALTFVEWGVDYLKYDNCYDQGRPVQQRYKAMGDALKSVTAGKNKTIYYSICEWGYYKPWLWGRSVGGNSWRTTSDISASWESIVSKINSQINITEYGGPGGWNDPDMLVLGFVEITYDEQVTHYAFWSAMKAPLILGCDLTKINDTSKELILNKDIISVNQDSLGLSVCQVYYKTDNKTSFDIWTGPLSDGYVAILLNRGIEPISIPLEFEKHCHLTGTIEVYDLVKRQSRGSFTNNYTAINIPKHGVEFIKLIGGNIIDNNRPCLNNSQSAFPNFQLR